MSADHVGTFPRTGTVYLIGACTLCAQVIVLGASGVWAHVPTDADGVPRLERFTLDERGRS